MSTIDFTDIEPYLPINLDGYSRDQMSIVRIREFEPPEGYYVAFSGGKDSICLLDLVKRAGVKYEAVYNVTTIDPPELVRFIKYVYPEVRFSHPEKSFWEHLPYEGLPYRQRRWCCEELKERGGEGRVVLAGVRASESPKRRARGMINVCKKKGIQKTMISPIFDWEDTDIWGYIRAREMSYCSLYDEGWKRLGCIFCPFETKRQLVKARWPKMWNALVYNVRKAWPAWLQWKPFQSDKRDWKAESPEVFLSWWWDNVRLGREDQSQQCFVFDQFEEEENDSDYA